MIHMIALTVSLVQQCSIVIDSESKVMTRAANNSISLPQQQFLNI